MPPYPLINFEIKNITKMNLNLIMGNRNITRNIPRIQAHDSIMCWYFCLGFIDFILKGKSLLEYTNLFSLNKYEKNEKIILKFFQQILKRLRWKKSIVLFLVSIENYKILKYDTFSKKH